jgi:hypothetical protein
MDPQTVACLFWPVSYIRVAVAGDKIVTKISSLPHCHPIEFFQPLDILHTSLRLISPEAWPRGGMFIMNVTSLLLLWSATFLKLA